jgi:hypothetical protein
MCPQPPQIYLESEGYRRLLDRIVGLAKTHDPSSPSDIRTEIIEALGDYGGIWPAYCLDDAPAGRAGVVAA